MISTIEDKKKLANAIKEISNSMTRMDAEKDLIKDIIQVAYEDFEIDKKHIRKLAAIYHRQNMSEVKYEYDEVETLYEELFKDG
jgi:hypothetical protein